MAVKLGVTNKIKKLVDFMTINLMFGNLLDIWALINILYLEIYPHF